MERYNKKRKCSKCGSFGTTDTLRRPGQELDPVFYVSPIVLATEEVIRRKCLNCGFRWSEKPLV